MTPTTSGVVYVMHGVVRKRHTHLLAHRFLHDRDEFIRHLMVRRHPYVSLEDAIAGKGDALTVDDSLVAGADAAELAREYGHQVTIFLNPYYVQSKAPYSLVLLSALLDSGPAQTFRHRGRSFSTRTWVERYATRRIFKSQIMQTRDEEERTSIVTRLARAMRVSLPGLSGVFESVSLDRLRRLVTLGVKLENHGWTHADLGFLAPAEREEEIQRGYEWIRLKAGCPARHFAPPFGLTLPDGYRGETGVWFLATDAMYVGHLGSRLINRQTLQLSSARGRT